MANKKKITPEILAYLKKNIDKKSNCQLAKELGFKETTIKHFLDWYGLKRTRYVSKLEPYWNDKRIAYLKRNINKKPNWQLAEALGTTEVAVRCAVKNHGLKRTPEAAAKFQAMNRNSVWTPALDKKLIKLYKTHTRQQCADKLGLRKYQVEKRLATLKIYLPADEREKRKQANYYKKGQPCAHPPPKGVRFSPATEYKKGNEPAATKWDGWVGIRNNYKRGTAYKWIRISKGKYMAYHHYIWKQAGRTIPKGHVLRFKNNDTLDVRLENLECVPRSAALYDNRLAYCVERDPEKREVIKKEFPELIELKRKQLELRRAINDKRKSDKPA